MGRFENWLWVGILGGLAALPAPVWSQSCPAPSVSPGDDPDVMDHVGYLADDGLAGRGVATDGERCAADYIADVFEALGLTPSGDGGSFFQSFQVRTGSQISPAGALTISPGGGEGGNPWTPTEREWRPYGFSGSGDVEGALTYAGEGLARPGQDGAEALPSMEGRVVVVEARTEGIPAGDLYADPHFKGTVAQGRGAAALILLDEDGPLPDPAREDRPFLRIPVVSVTGGAAARLREVARAGGRGNLRAEIKPALSEARNVVALLPGSDPTRAGEVVVVGAHYDHLGMGGAGSLAPGQVAIHNGADDNASGTAALIDVARALARGPAPARPVLFIAFSGEERGLLGSGHYVREPTVGLGGAVAMLNMDMVGRLRENQLTVFGLGTAPQWEDILQGANHSLGEPFALTLAPDGYGPSDHSSFYGAGIPVLHFFTNTHSEYHRPEDDVETLNGPGLERVAALVALVAAEVAGEGEASAAAPELSLIEAEPPQPSESGGRGYGPYFGSIPDMGSPVYGVRLTGVREGSPAEAAGLRAGDVIVGFGGDEVGDLYAYTYALRERKPGDAVDVIVMREGRRLTLQAVLGERR